MDTDKVNKVERILGIYTKLLNGYTLNKIQEAQDYGVDVRTIQRDIDDIRNFVYMDSGGVESVDYCREEKGYYLKHIYKAKFTNSEVLAICKIILDSRAFTKKEMYEMLEKLVECCVPRSNHGLVKKLIGNEKLHYIELQHKTVFIGTMWKIGQAINHCQYIEIDYEKRKGKEMVKRRLKPVAIMFSEYYFYLTAFIDDEETQQYFDVLNDSFPTIYRMDRIKKLKVLDAQFAPLKNRFEEGEFRKRVQFMYGGKLQRVKFEYSGESIEAVLDRIPTAKILKKENGIYTISAEVFGKGIDMWLRSQGDLVKVLTTNGMNSI